MKIARSVMEKHSRVFKFFASQRVYNFSQTSLQFLASEFTISRSEFTISRQRVYNFSLASLQLLASEFTISRQRVYNFSLASQYNFSLCKFPLKRKELWDDFIFPAKLCHVNIKKIEQSKQHAVKGEKSCLNRIMTDFRSSLDVSTVDVLMFISLNGPDHAEYNYCYQSWCKMVGLRSNC